MATVQPGPLSRARLIFLVVLVVFFCGLFIASYIWMRRPSFGQGGRPASGVAGKGLERSGASLSSCRAGDVPQIVTTPPPARAIEDSLA